VRTANKFSFRKHEGSGQQGNLATDENIILKYNLKSV
jgi:hypothetical protein